MEGTTGMTEGNLNGSVRFKDQVALVVGGAQGIGKAIALRLAGEGAVVAIADMDVAAMNGTVQEMCTQAFEVRGVPCDVRNSGQVNAMVERILKWYGRID